MKNIISISEAMGDMETPSGVAQIRATAEGSYDPESQTLVVTLGNALIPHVPRAVPPQHPEWLPGPQRVEEFVRAEEATALARDIFHQWVAQVRNALPPRHPRAVCVAVLAQ